MSELSPDLAERGSLQIALVADCGTGGKRNQHLPRRQ